MCKGPGTTPADPNDCHLDILCKTVTQPIGRDYSGVSGYDGLPFCNPWPECFKSQRGGILHKIGLAGQQASKMGKKKKK